MIKQNKYISIAQVSKLLDLNAHVIRYWDSKFDGISIRLGNKKQRFFNNDNIKKINELKKILYQNGKHNNSLALANKLVEKKVKNTDKNKILVNKLSINQFDINKLKKIRDNLKKIYEL